MLFVFYKTPSSHITWKQCHDRFYRIGRAQEQSRNFARKLDPSLYFQWNSSGRSREASVPLSIDQTKREQAEARRAGKKKFESGRPPYLRVWMTALPPPLPPPHLKAWIHLWTVKLLYDCCKSVFLFRWNVLEYFFTAGYM